MPSTYFPLDIAKAHCSHDILYLWLVYVSVLILLGVQYLFKKHIHRRKSAKSFFLSIRSKNSQAIH